MDPRGRERAKFELSEILQTVSAVKAAEGQHTPGDHLAEITEFLDRHEILRSFVSLHATMLEHTAEDMRRFMLKQSAARRRLLSKEKQVARQRKLLLLPGRRNAFSATDQVTTLASNFWCLSIAHCRQDHA